MAIALSIVPALRPSRTRIAPSWSLFGMQAVDSARPTRASSFNFSGTENFLQFMVEVDHVIFRPKKPSPIGGQVAEYFMDVFTHLWERGIATDVRALIAAHPGKYWAEIIDRPLLTIASNQPSIPVEDYEIWVTGHSLGGAIASIAGAAILAELKVENERIKVITFGQPRTGDREYAAAYDEKVRRLNTRRFFTRAQYLVFQLPRTYRVVHSHDLVS